MNQRSRRKHTEFMSENQIYVDDQLIQENRLRGMSDWVPEEDEDTTVFEEMIIGKLRECVRPVPAPPHEE